MKYLLIPGTLLLALLGACLVNAELVGDSVSLTCEGIEHARRAVEGDDWTQAHTALAETREAWDRRKHWLHLVIGHNALDEADALFAAAESFADEEDAPEFLAESARLAAGLRHLAMTQELSVRNIL